MARRRRRWCSGAGAVTLLVAFACLVGRAAEGDDPAASAVEEAFRALGVEHPSRVRVRDVSFFAALAPRLLDTGRLEPGARLPSREDPLRHPLIDEAVRQPLAAVRLAARCLDRGEDLFAPSPPPGPGPVPRFDPLPPEATVPAAVRHLAASLAAIDEAARASLPAGRDDPRLEAWLVDGIEAEAVPAARRTLDAWAEVNVASLRDRTMRLLGEAVVRLREPTGEWPASAPLRIETPRGVVVVGTPGDDIHEEDAWLLVDPGGNDVYRNNAGGTGASLRSALSVDCGGDDRYESDRPFVQGAARGGVGMLVDLGGDDRYDGGAYCQAAAVGGVAVLLDAAGDDVYDARRFAQGAAALGHGVLSDLGGDDAYAVDQLGQGLGRTAGVGVLRDVAGNDRYRARDVHDSPYSAWTNGRPVTWSFAQGCGFGFYARYERALPDGKKELVIHDLIPGGVGVLIDASGDDAYEGSMYAQGTAYFQGLGILADRAGNDRYRATWYGQGAAPHFACGILADGGGDDHYVGMHQVQGSARDFATAVLLDRGGNDVYEAEDRAQGCGDHRDAYGIFVDLAGDDRYRAGARARGCVTLLDAKDEDRSPSHHLDWGIFVDLAGQDRYEGEAPGAEGTRWIEPATRRGIGIDR